MLKSLFITCILLAVCGEIVAQCPYNQAGLLSFSSLYAGIPPTANITVTGKVLLDVVNVEVGNIVISDGGALIFRDIATNLTAHLIYVGVGGALQIGAPNCAITNQITITLTGPRSTVNEMFDGVDNIAMGTKGIGVSSGGAIDVHGVSPQPTWTRLSETAYQNSTSITLTQPVDWQIGNSIVIATTDFPGIYLGEKSTSDPATFVPLTTNPWVPSPIPALQSEERKIVAISTDRRTLTLDAMLNYPHYGFGDMAAEVALLTRNIIIQGDDTSNATVMGGHIMLRNVVNARFTAVELTRMGQKGIVGRYPIHFHLMGSSIDPDNRYIKDSSAHHLYQRCMVVHTSHGVMIKNNVAFDTNGHCYFLEDGPETYNTFDGNIGILSRPIFETDPDGVSRRIIVADAAPSIFWIVNPNNTVINNVAVEGQNGFWYSLPDAPVGISVNCCGSLVPRRVPLLLFKGNVAHSTGSGLFVDKGIMNSVPAGMVAAKTNYAPTTPAIFQDFIAYKNRDFGVWTQSENVHVFNARLYDNLVGARMIAGRNSLQNALVVVDTDNFGVPAIGQNRSRPLRYNAEVTGWMYYDHGSQSIRNVTFVNFNSTKTRAAFAITFPCQPHPHNAFMKLDNLRFFNSTEFKIPNSTACFISVYDNLKSVNVMDVDGSTTGWTGGWIITNHSFHKSPGCVAKPEWIDAAKCPPLPEGYVRFIYNVAIQDVPTVFNLTAPPTKIWLDNLEQQEAGPLSLRGDATMSGTPLTITGYNFATNVKASRSYRVRWNSNAVPDVVNLRFGEYPQPGDYALIVLPYPRTANLTFSGSYTPASSLNALRENTYFYDSTTELLYVRYSANEENNGGSPRSTWASWAAYNLGSGEALTVRANCTPSSDLDVQDWCQAPASNQADFVVPLPTRREQLFQADLVTCANPRAVPYRLDMNVSGTANFFYDPVTTRLWYHIVHNVGLAVTGVQVQYQSAAGETGSIELVLPVLPVSPLKGYTYLSRSSHKKLISGKIRTVITTDDSPNGILFGYMGCLDTSTCTLPEPAVSVQPCDIQAINSTVDLYANGSSTSYFPNVWSGGSSAYVISPTNDDVIGVCGSKPIKAMIGGSGFLNVGVNGTVTLPFLDAKFKYLEFYIKAVMPDNGLIDFAVTLRGPSSALLGLRVRIMKKHILDQAISSQWTRVRIPLSDFNVTQTIAFRYFQITPFFPNNARPTFYLDQIRLSSVEDGAAAVEPGSPTSVAPYVANKCPTPGVLVTTTAQSVSTSQSTPTSQASSIYFTKYLIAVMIVNLFLCAY